MTPGAPATLDRAGIAARVPHRGRMCLLDRLLGWDALAIECTAAGHADPAHPLRTDSGLLALVAIEYAAQAMALQGALIGAAAAPAPPAPGYLASVRGVCLAVVRLDDVPGELRVRARRLAGDARQILYRFEVADAAGRPLADGRATVVLDAPLRAAPCEGGGVSGALGRSAVQDAAPPGAGAPPGRMP